MHRRAEDDPRCAPVGRTSSRRASHLVQTAREVQEMPYRWPMPSDAVSTELAGSGSCAGKHALLAERLEAIGLNTCPLIVVGPLAPALWPDLVAEAAGLIEVHECLTVLTPWAGPVTVDVTWHPAAVRAGLPGLPEDWDGTNSTPIAVAASGPGFSVNRRLLRTTKEALRSALYSDAERERRDEILAEIARRAETL